MDVPLLLKGSFPSLYQNVSRQYQEYFFYFFVCSCEIFDNGIISRDYLLSNQNVLCSIYIMIQNICCVTVFIVSVYVCHKAIFFIMRLTIQVKMFIINSIDCFRNFIVF